MWKFFSMIMHFFALMWHGVVDDRIQLTDGGEFFTLDQQTIEKPADETVIDLLYSQCNTVKTLLHENYHKNRKPDLSKLTLDLFTREVSITFKLSDAAELIPRSQYFKHQNMIIVYFPGFTDNPHLVSFQTVNKAFLEQGDYHVLALDASSKIGGSTMYTQATTNVHYIGQKVGAVLAKMVEMGSKPESIYLIGHSLGAHIAGFTGKTFKALTGHSIGRITGLDPAGPCFTTVSEHLKLNASDAQFVDVIHTNAGVLGINERIGHIDFSPNGGSAQPDCVTKSCNHNRVWELYAETVVYPQNMPAVSCDSWNAFKQGQCNTGDISYMGFGCSNTTRGTYFLQTAGSTPFGLGISGMEYEANSGILTNIVLDFNGV